ncbi:hypothetical protein POL68_25575 [Stigmatella sp. ncwal1]|uniref:Lipoprotein n=1 Tax=Stigmatella ashevillensis TaxID=2995309 RepID=A0ABT5DFL3_9BACT|nr:hypothetical protein [Stigmatella ashevillena]MDC0711864.1 hypothetical protein [Stigmatella ashevillena]
MTCVSCNPWFAAGAVIFLLGCGPLEAPGEAAPEGTVEQALTNTCHSTAASYTFTCATVNVYGTAGGGTPIDTIPCGGAYWSVTLLKACPTNERFQVEYAKGAGAGSGTGWVSRTVLVAPR